MRESSLETQRLPFCNSEADLHILRQLSALCGGLTPFLTSALHKGIVMPSLQQMTFGSSHRQ
jgi:hypothetical protein